MIKKRSCEKNPVKKKSRSVTTLTKEKPKREYHFIGIGGIGMSALARILLQKNEKVSGSDVAKGEMVKELEKMGARIVIGHKGESVKKGSAVIYTSSIKRDNPEMMAAREKKCTLLHRSQMLWELTKGTTPIAVAGTHGKTTTSSLLTYLLHHAGYDPSFAVGGYIPNLANGKEGRSKYFVLEADESDGSFLNYSPHHAIITNIECDHMEYYKTEKAVIESFKVFMSQVKEHLLYSGDDPRLESLKLKRGITFGFKKGCDAHISHFEQKEFSISFDLTFEKNCFEKITLPLSGKHNAMNGAAVFALAIKLGIDEKKIRMAFASFPGVKRRLEKRGEAGGITFYDDYAHHPTEVKSTLIALKKAIGDRRMIVLFQPHRFTRLSFHMEQFSRAFEIADELIITDLYSAGEEPIHGVTAERLVTLISASSTLPCSFVSMKELPSNLAKKVRPHDVVVTLGAGSLTSIHDSLMGEIKKNPPKKHLLGLIFGGKSCEHEISLRSARYVFSSLNRSYYEVKCFAIDKEGGWIVGKEAEELLQKRERIEGGRGKSLLATEIAKELESCELFFPALHGTFGEDGTIQGFFEMLGKPYAGPDCKSSSIAMDKVLTKRILMQAGVLTPPYLTFTFREWVREEEALVTKMEEELKFPLIVKPRNLGSSIGVKEVKTKEELKKAITFAFQFDSEIIVEKRLKNCREIEFPILGSERDDVKVPHPAEKLAKGKVVDYEMKYSQNPVKMTLEPTFAPEILEKGKEMAKAAYLAIGIKGMGRVDSLLDKKGNFWIHEVNTIPGMTSLSFFPKVWAREGLKGDVLFDKIILAALARHRTQKRHLKLLPNVC